MRYHAPIAFLFLAALSSPALGESSRTRPANDWLSPPITTAAAPEARFLDPPVYYDPRLALRYYAYGYDPNRVRTAPVISDDPESESEPFWCAVGRSAGKLPR